jgi:hypothetical protein
MENRNISSNEENEEVDYKEAGKEVLDHKKRDQKKLRGISSLQC